MSAEKRPQKFNCTSRTSWP